MTRKITLAITAAALLAVVLSFTSAGLANDQIRVGDLAPEFELSDQHGQLHSLEDYRDQWVVLYFYPKDDTPGCTTEACEFRDNIFAYKDLNAQILGVSVKTRMFGMTVAKRQTFIIGPDGLIAKHYEKVDPENHSAQVLSDLKVLADRG
jgi:peroxiredoxin Q/BCP